MVLLLRSVAIAVLGAVFAGPAGAQAVADCPPGTSPAEVKVPGKAETEKVCLRPDGKRQGPGRRFDASGGLIAEGSYVDGRPEGVWRLVEKDGLVRVGAMKAGVPDGPWTTLSGREAVATVTWRHLSPGAGRGVAAEGTGAPQQVRDAAEVWRTPIPGQPTALEWDGERAWIQAANRVHVVDGIDGTVVVVVDPGEALRPGVLLGDHTGVGVTRAGELLWIDPLAMRWHKVRTPLGLTDVAAVDGDSAWVRDGSGRISQVDVRTGQVAWRSRPYVDEALLVSVPGRIVGARGPELVAVSDRDGEPVWTRRLGAAPVQLEVSDDLIVALGAKGQVTLVDGFSGELVWTRTLGELAGGARVQVHPDGVLVAAGPVVRMLDLRTGDPLPAVILGPKGDADLWAGTACLATDVALVCEQADGAWTVAGGPAAGAPMIVDGGVLQPLAEGALRWVDPVVARVRAGLMPGGDAELLEDRVVDVAVATADGGEEWLSMPWTVIERPAGDGCSRRVGHLDMRGAGPWPSAVDAGVVVLPVPPEEGAEAVVPTPEEPEVVLPWAVTAPIWVRQPDEGVVSPEDGTVAPGWELEVSQETWSMGWWFRWLPSITSARPASIEPLVREGVAAALQCAGPAVAFRGQAVLQNGTTLHTREGMLALFPEAQSVDGLDGCLVEVRLNNVSDGWWSGGITGGWEQLIVSVDGAADGVFSGSPRDASRGLPLVVDGPARVELLLPGRAERTVVEATTELRMTLSQDDLLGLQWLEIWLDGRLWTRRSMTGLRPGRVGWSQGEPVLVPDVEREVVLRHFGADPPALDLVPVWSELVCPAE